MSIKKLAAVIANVLLFAFRPPFCPVYPPSSDQRKKVDTHFFHFTQQESMTSIWRVDIELYFLHFSVAAVQVFLKTHQSLSCVIFLNYLLALMGEPAIKGTVTRDFLLLVFS
jgi:hypothetical protein